MDQRHIKHVNEKRLNEINDNNKKVENYHKKKSQEEMHNHAERGFFNQLKDARYIPEKRVFV